MVIETFVSLTPQRGVVYQKMMPDGTMAMRMEMAMPTNAMPPGMAGMPASYTLVTSLGAYTVMGDKVIKMNGMPGMDKLKDFMNPEALKKLTQDAQSAQVNYGLTNGMVDGKECWIVSIPTSAAALEAVKKAMDQGPQKDLMAAIKMKMSAIPLPAQSVIFFDKQSALMVKQECLDSSNRVLQSMTYQNLQPNVEIQDQMFKLPENIQIEDMSAMMQVLLRNTKLTK